MSFADARDRGLLRAYCDHVVDGDTFDVMLDLGVGQYGYETVRLHDFDTAEINSGTAEDRLRGQAATARTTELIAEKHVLVKTFRDAQTFGRYVADVWYFDASSTDWRSLRDTLDAEGFAK